MSSDPGATVIEAALALWGLAGSRATLVAERENRVYRVDQATTGEPVGALRLHRPGYRSDAELTAELDWMAALARGGLAVPAPLLSVGLKGQGGARLHRVGGQQVSLLSWLDAKPMGTTGEPLFHPDPPALFTQMGQALARLHTVSDQWTPPEEFSRWRWDAEGLLGETPLWDRFWDNPTLSPEDAQAFAQFRQYAKTRLRTEADSLDFGLIHADMVRENVMIGTDGALSLIDFDDGGWGYRLFDIATALIKNRAEPDYPALQAALIAGYQRERALDVSALDLFMALRAVTYVGWIITRLNEPGGTTRNSRMVAQARALIDGL
jgi:Ser/Thr protein kinase RdoA (MazF antagonist)